MLGVCGPVWASSRFLSLLGDLLADGLGAAIVLLFVLGLCAMVFCAWRGVFGLWSCSLGC